MVLNKHYSKKSYLWTPLMIKYTQARCEKCMLVQLLQMSPNLGKPMDCDPPGSSVHGNFQATILEWLAISFSGGSFWPRDWTHISYLGRWILYHCATWEDSVTTKNCLGQLKMKTRPSQLPCKLNTVIEKVGWFLQETKQVGTPLGLLSLKNEKPSFYII